ncbi:MAG: hypothetical protein E7574_04520 [Ruminococcaceae bacterium]|nr:hypothetical protein [Oscillospiraceae bacterium]
MKNFAKLLVMALVVTLFASLFVFSASAAAKTPAGFDPNTLKPSSDAVIFIKDAERDPVTGAMTGTIEGDGTGKTPDNPLRPTEHPNYDATASSPKKYLQTAFYQATEELKETGGTIVFVGPVTLGINESYGSSATNRDVLTAEFGKSNKVIKFTSVYNGVDYRQTADAKLIIEKPAHVGVLGSSIWDDITVVTEEERMFWFDEYATLIGPGFQCVPNDENQEGVAAHYLSLNMGHRYQKRSNENPTLVVKGGTFNRIWGANWGITANYPVKNSTVNITLEGTTRVLGMITGSCSSTKLDFGGNVTITINGGTYTECDIFGVGPTGLTNADGRVTIKINDGIFKDLFSIAEVQPEHTNNAPAVSVLDLSGFKGEKIQMAYILDVMETFKEVKLPAGVTEQELADLLAAVPPETDAPVTDAPVTDAPATDAPATDAPATQKPATQKPATTPAPTDNGEEGGEFPTAIVIIAAVAVVAIAAVVVVIVLKKKKAAK